MFEQSQPEPSPQRRLRYPVMLELIILGFLAVVLVIGLTMIRSLVAERANRAESVRMEIASSWGQRQTVGGPVLIIPYRQRYLNVNGREQVVVHRGYFLPSRLETTGQLYPERRQRGIFETVLYRADLKLAGTFDTPDFSKWSVAAEDILWNEAVVTLGITDLRGIRGRAAMQWNGGEVPFGGGSADPRLWATGLTAPLTLPVPAPGAPNAKYPFRIDLRLNGSEQLQFLPLGGETVVDLRSSWADPSFGGAYLPESRSVAPTGFTARWTISSLARSYPQRWRDLNEEHASTVAAIAPSAFGVGLISPVGHYQKTERSMKYGALFIVLTFLTFFLYELLSPVTLHPVQYFLVGGALCLFYLLLLSISEHAPFALAYAIGSFATIALITAYSAALLKSAMRVLGLAGFLTLLYGYLYVLLQLEDWALLMGSIGLFLILGLVMYTTRRVDWGSAHQSKAVV